MALHPVDGAQVGHPVSSRDGGRAIFDRLLPGTYSLCETPKTGFIAQPYQSVTLTSGQKPTLFFANVSQP